MPKSNKVVYSANDRAIVDAVRGSENGMTLAEINQATGLNLKAGHIVSALKKELIRAEGERIVTKPSTRSVATYNYVSSDIMKKADGKDHNYSDGEKAILAAASTFSGAFTLADLATAMGVEKIASGSTNALVKKGNLSKGDAIEIACESKSKVKTYVFNKDIPTE